MSKAFLDTTILADALLKSHGEGKVARQCIAAFDECLTPQYALKELKGGVLKNYIWLHTKALTSASYSDVMLALTKMWARPNLSSTSLRAFSDFESSISNRVSADFWKAHPHETEGKLRKDELQTWLLTLIIRAWRKRRKIAAVVAPLSCYEEKDLSIAPSGAIDASPIACDVDDCCLRAKFSKRRADLASMLGAFDALPKKSETGRRKEALDRLHRTPSRPMSEKDCKALGDAVFALTCPRDAVLITTNIRDHKPLGESLGLKVQLPIDFIKP